MVKGTELTTDNITEIITLLANNESDNEIITKFHIGHHRLTKLKNKYITDIDSIRNSLALSRQKEIPSKVSLLIDNALNELKTDKTKLNKAKYQDICKSLKEMHHILRLETGQSTANEMLISKGMTDDQLREYIMTGNTPKDLDKTSNIEPEDASMPTEEDVK